MAQTHPHHPHNLTPAKVAKHLRLTTDTVREKLRAGELAGIRIGRDWRCSWPDVWAVERGPTPRGPRQADYERDLLTKRDLAARWGVSVRTLERWIAYGLPTRNAFASTRIAPVDADAWCAARFGLLAKAE